MNTFEARGQHVVSPFQMLLSEHVGASFARQLALADFLGERNWNLTLSTGRVRFGDDLEYPIQLLGSEASGSNAWLWAWANEHIEPSPESMVAGKRLRQLGQERGIDVLTEPSFSLDAADGHAISLVASGVVGRCCYYRGPYDGGAAFFLVTGVPDGLLAPVPPERAITVIMEVISQFEVDHRLLVLSFLRSQGYGVRQEEKSLVASRNGRQMTLSFDELGRLANIGGTVLPAASPTNLPAARPTKRWWEFWKP